MMSVLLSLLPTLRRLARSRAALHLEVLALRYQLHVLQRSRPAAGAAREDRPLAMGMVVTRVDRVAVGARHCPTQDGHCMASPHVPAVLDVEEWPTHRQTDRAG